MGQNGSVSNNPLLMQWRQNPLQPNIYTHTKTNDQVEKYTLNISLNDQFLYKRRMQEQHQFIVKVHYYQLVTNRVPNQIQQTCSVYIDRLMPIKKHKWEPITTALRILKGFRRLSTTYGLMKVTEDMVKMNEKDQIKVWINKNPAVNQPLVKAINQEQMLTDIAKIIIKYDAQTSAHLIGCLTLNQAINNILVNMTESKTQANLSSRTLRPEDKAKRNQINGEIPAKNKSNQFRDTKETQDEFPKPLYSHEKRVEDKIALNKSPNSKYLLNVHVPNSPKYLPLGSQTQKKGVIGYNYKNNISDVVQRNQMVNFSDKLPSKESNNSLQFSSFQQQKKENQLSKKNFRPVEHKIPSHHIGATSSILGYSSGSPRHQIKMKNQSPEFSSEISLKKTGSGSQIHLYDRKSDLHRQYVQGREQGGRASDFITMMQTGSQLKISYNEKFGEQKGQMESLFYNPKQESMKSGIAKQKISQNFRVENQSRAKTQEFNSLHIIEDNSYGSEINQKKRPGIRSEIQNEEMGKYYGGVFDKKKLGMNNNGLNKNNEVTQSKVDIINTTKIQVVPDEKTQQSQILAQKKGPTSKIKKMQSFPTNYNELNSKQENLSQEKDRSESNKNASYEQRKVQRQEMSKKIRDQFSSILSVPSKNQGQMGNRLTKEKSSKDILIRQKIEKKKAIFAGLKNEMKMLMGDQM